MTHHFQKTISTRPNTKKPVHARCKGSAIRAVANAGGFRKSSASVRGSRKTGGATRVPDKMVQVAPNLFVSKGANTPPPELVLCNVVPNGDGLYRLESRTWERFERVNSGLSRKLGLGSRTDTLRRLIRGGFVGGSRVAPKLYTINLESYWSHYDRCAEDPDFWSNPKVRAEYWTAI